MKTGWEPYNIGGICAVDWGNTNLTKSVYVEAGPHLAVSAAGCDGRIGHWEHRVGTPVLSAIGAQCGKMFYPDEDFTAIKNTITLTPKSGICDGKFLFHLLNHVTLPQRGAGQPFISKGDIQKFPVSVPPLDEQRRIVAVLDKAFAGIASATANAQKNLINARALFESYLRSVFDAPNTEWQRSTLGKLTSKIGSGATPRGGKDAYKDDGTPLIRSMNVHDRYFKDRNLAFIDDQQAKLLNNVVVQKCDVLLNITGASVARCCLVPEKMTGARVNQHVAIIRTNADKIRPEFLELALTSPYYKETLLGVGEKGGSTRQAITKSGIQTLEVAFPALAAQDSIVDHATELQIETRKLATIASQKLAALTELKQSLLQRAFAGELA